MTNKIVFVFVAGLLCQSFAFDFEQSAIFRKIEHREEFTADVSAKSFNEQTCTNQLNLFSNALANREFWALRLFDTWAKIESGYLSTIITSMGHMTDCLSFRHETTSGNIRGQHCMVTVFPTGNSTITPDNPIDPNSRFDWRELGSFARSQGLFASKAICAPASCSPQRVATFANTFLIEADLQAVGVTCLTDEQDSLEVVDYVGIVIFSILGILLIASTIYDVFMRSKDMEPHKLLISFSAYTNGRKLYDITENNSPSNIKCLNGLRACSVFWIIFGHRVNNQLNVPVSNFVEVIDFFDSPLSIVVSNYHLAVDTFFLMGGLLVTISVMNAHERGRLNVLRMVYQRYIRYTPAWAAVILFSVSLYRFTYLSHYSAGLRQVCIDMWWAALLHIQNYVNANNMCMNFSWYLSADFQLFIISPFLVYPAIKFGRKYIWSLPLLGFMSCIYVLTIMLVFGIYANGRDGGQQFFAKWIYFPTHARIGPWMVGMTLGYSLFELRNKRIEISKAVNALMWTVSITLLLLVVCFNLPVSAPVDNDTSLVSNAIYSGFHRYVWAVGISWMIFACHHLKTGGIVRWFLELRQFQPICRMGLSLYLVHAVYQLMTMFNTRQSLFLSVGQMIHLFWGDIVASIACATILYLLVENPFVMIDQYFQNLRDEKRKREHQPKQI